MRLLWLLLVICISQSLGGNPWNPDKRKFPSKILFGTATSAYQVEGAWNIDGKGESILDHYYHSSKVPVADGTTGDVTTDSYHHWRRDVEMLRQTGVDYYRFSIAWSRVLPTGLKNEINEKGLKYYDDILEELKKYNIEPMVTMYHFDLPQPLQDMGGWTNPLVVQWFQDYATVLFDRFAKKVKYWLTINNPDVCFAMYSGQMAPALHSQGVHDYVCAKHMLLAHANVYKIYKENYRNKDKVYIENPGFSWTKTNALTEKPSVAGLVGIAINMNWADPVDMNNGKDKDATDLYKDFSFGLFLHPIFDKIGGWPQRVKDTVAKKSKEEGLEESRLPAFSDQEIKLLRQSADFLGMNHYTSHFVRYSTKKDIGKASTHLYKDIDVVLSQGEEWSQAKSTWLRGAPYGLYKACLHINKMYDYPPVIITEHGFSTETGLEDKSRIANMREYFKSALFAIEDGTNLRGITIWSLMDNFEWNAGFTERFGLFEVDFKSPDRTRTPRRSAFFLRDVIDQRTVRDDWQPSSDRLNVSERRARGAGGAGGNKDKQEL